ncbi:AcrB/AcrD/AcrF family protein [Sphingomonas koreensis]|nr:AcrB/AcrD/AcrF family protein [Sphingomonas koreensis]
MNDSTGGAWAIKQELDRHWLRLTLLAWLLVAIWLLWDNWGHIYWFALGDTDDNMRLAQVRALLNGQGWYDLRQYRMNPPGGFDIHWTRIVDLPIAGLILLFRLFTTDYWAERLACGIAPILPLAVVMAGVAVTARRLIDPLAWPLALALLLVGAPATMPMFEPERIDLGGWQLAMLSLIMAGLADPERRRGGLIMGLATACSLSIGLELLPYAAIGGAIVVLRWVWDRAAAPRLTVYALALSGGTAVGFALFASDANRALRCDSLTPVYLTAMIAAGLLMFALTRLNPAARSQRLALAVVAAAILAGGFALLFPQCLGRPEQVSPELARNWLDNVREAKPIYKQPSNIIYALGVMPVIGLFCTAIAAWRARREPIAVPWVSLLILATCSSGMLLWQVRVGPDAQMLVMVGVTALLWVLVPGIMRHSNPFVRVLGVVGAVAFLSGAFVGITMPYMPFSKPNARLKTVNKASRFCPTVPAMQALDRYPAQVVFTFVDLGPRLIATTHHDAIAGPYHRNGDAILDVQHGFQGSPDQFRAIAAKHKATLLLICPNMAESTNYRARAPGGFYDQLAHGKTFPWLKQLPLPAKDPLRLFQIE